MKPKVVRRNNKYYFISTQKELANFLGVTEQTIVHWKGKTHDLTKNGAITIEDYDPERHIITIAE